MFRAIGAAVVFALWASVTLAQGLTTPPEAITPPIEPISDATEVVVPGQVAAVDPNAPLPVDTSVVGQCSTMAGDVNLANTTSGPCITAAQAYIALLGPTLAANPTAGDQALSDTVGKIAELTQDDICDVRDEELATAIDAAAAAAVGADTKSSLSEIAATIREVCKDGTTAAITDGSPA